MGLFCDLEVDVNGEGVFMVDKELLSSYSGKLCKLFGTTSPTSNLKLIFHDFPGGAGIFELVARFCYNNGNIEINPANLGFLHSAAIFMEMSKVVSATENFIEKTEKSLKEISSWTWSDLLLVLKQSQDLSLDISTSGIVQKCLDSLVERLAVTAENSPCPSSFSPDSSGFRISCDSRSTESMKTSCSRATWWFDDLSVLDWILAERVVSSMVLRKFNHGAISKFLFHYQKSKFVLGNPEQKCRILEMVINSLYCLDHWSMSYRSLMGILRVSLNLNISKGSRSKLESIIGTRLDDASLDNLLVPSPLGANYLYDVNLVLRFLRSFLIGAPAMDRVIRVGQLLDMYLAEVAPDPSLKPSKFIALATILPDSSRDSYDEMYHAMDMYLEVHIDLSEEETFKICSALNYEKLSREACVHLSKNKRFPSRSAVQALLSQQSKLKTLLRDANYPPSCSSSPSNYPEFGEKDTTSDQIVLYAGQMDVTAENDDLRKHLQGMQWRVTELEKVCQKMQAQMAKMTMSKSSSNMSPKSLPKLCS